MRLARAIILFLITLLLASKISTDSNINQAARAVLEYFDQLDEIYQIDPSSKKTITIETEELNIERTNREL